MPFQSFVHFAAEKNNMSVISAFYEHCYTIPTLYKMLNQSAMLWFIHVDQMKATVIICKNLTMVAPQYKNKKEEEEKKEKKKACPTKW